MTDTENNVRDMLREHARRLLDRADNPECDVRTMVAQAKQTAALAEAELDEREPVKS